MTTWAQPINEDNAGIKTAAAYGDRGDTTNDWYAWIRVADGGHVSIGAKADAAVEGGATTGSLIALTKGVQKALGVSTDAVVPTGNGYIIGLLKAIRDNQRKGTPSDAVFVNVIASGAAGIVTATMPAVAAKTNYLTGFEITGAGASAASNIIAALTGTISTGLSYSMSVPASTTTEVRPLIVTFDPPIPASAVNTAIVMTIPSFGAGNTVVICNLHGYLI